ncbi:MAG: hypothetical protein A3F41_01985 [Coxiella sp. RIFCSPHIGHO2_12_FULL_44_14]|nr:MAG: hypothetical protein A3F41_01985 [Coxiella sp. RIFCSPHIGHO2_12_FULL_44_14]
MPSYFHQYLLDELLSGVKPQKVVVIYGPRQVGKTTLLEHFLKSQTNYLLVSGDDIFVRHHLSSQSIDQLKEFVGGKSMLVVDEAQRIPHIGSNLKLLVDHCSHLSIVATGSSSFDLAQQMGEPLTGRKITLQMYPLSQMELSAYEHVHQTEALRETRLLYGSYPEVVKMNNATDRREYLQELVRDYLFKDILELDGVKQVNKITKLLQLLAFQIGKEVSSTEIAGHVGLSKNTVHRYLDLLEKSFVLVPLYGFSRNLRKEITKMPKYYFYDVGVRNALINQFNSLSVRQDVGDLWENYLVMERIKKMAYQRIHKNYYFWRTYDQQEIDWVEEGDGMLHGYEFKWKEQTVKPPTSWQHAYPHAQFTTISSHHYLDFIT